ncbi:hypothetical protein [Flavobacterium sp.]|uniref:hypothetical protein n=1 Tax=Flavobacterium sp. TaxID=239 RepID=UPI004047D381
MKKIIKCSVLILTFLLASCYGTEDDTDNICNGNCNVFNGRVYTENNNGIPDVEITLSYTLNQIGANYERIIAKSKTDANGNYIIEAFIKDSEFNVGFFHLTLDENKIESSITSEFYKPSELVNEVAPRINECSFSDLENRNQITTIDYRIPYKTNFTVNLNDYNLTTPNDRFGVGNRIEYGFQRGYNRFLTKQSTATGFGYADGLNTTLIIPAVYGENYLTIYKFKNGLVDNVFETITINNPNTSEPLNYSY